MSPARLIATAVLPFLLLAGWPAAARDTVHRFRPADAAVRQVWAALLRQDADLARDVRRKRFDPKRDLRALRVDLDGDGRPELVLYADLITFCGSAGCMIRLFTPRAGGWALACETYVDDGIGLVVEDIRSAGWRNLRGTYRVTWRKDVTAPAGVVCAEGEAIPRSRQGR